MRSLLRPAAAFVLLGLLALPIQAADSAGSLFKKGRDAEARQKYEDAYALYKQAYDLKPTDLKYRSASSVCGFLPVLRMCTVVKACAKKASSLKPWRNSKPRSTSILQLHCPAGNPSHPEVD